jgi:hypothetical protein
MKNTLSKKILGRGLALHSPIRLCAYIRENEMLLVYLRRGEEMRCEKTFLSDAVGRMVLRAFFGTKSFLFFCYLFYSHGARIDPLVGHNGCVCMDVYRYL